MNVHVDVNDASVNCNSINQAVESDDIQSINSNENEAKLNKIEFLRVARPGKHGHSRWNFFAIMCTSWDIRYFPCTSGHLFI